MWGVRSGCASHAALATRHRDVHELRDKEGGARLIRVLATLRQLAGRRFNWYITLLLGNALLPVAAALVARQVVDGLVAGESWTALLPLLLLEATIVVVFVSVEQVLSYLSEELRFLLTQEIQIRNCQQAASLDIAYYEDPEQCNSLHRLRRESYVRPVRMVWAIGNMLRGMTTTLGFFIAIALWQPLLAVLFLVGTLPLLRWGQRAATSSWMSHDLSTADGRRAAYFSDLLCERDAAKEVRLYNLAPLVIPRLRAYDMKHRQTQMAGVAAKTLLLIPGRVAGVVAQYGAVALAAYQVAQQSLSIGRFTLVIAALASCRQIFQGIVAEYVEFQENRHYFRELLQFWALQPKTGGASKHLAVAPLQSSVRFEGLSFRYPGTDNWALRDVNIEIPRGGSLAIVGLNGAGKSTLIKLLARLYEPSEGRILWDGVDIATLDHAAYRQELSIAFQDFVQYQLSLKENVTIGSPSNYDSTWMGRVLGFLGLQRLTDGLPQGVDTLLGRQFHVHGVELSGGQWQRVALARALYRTETASLLVLDEPTSAMDAQQEASLYDSINEWKRNRTLILISHRLSSVRNCDKIVVLDGGRVIEEGDHETLMHTRGMYQRLFEVQARGYSPTIADGQQARAGT